MKTINSDYFLWSNLHFLKHGKQYCDLAFFKTLKKVFLMFHKNNPFSGNILKNSFGNMFLSHSQYLYFCKQKTVLLFAIKHTQVHHPPSQTKPTEIET